MRPVIRPSRGADGDRRANGANSAQQIGGSRKVVPGVVIVTKPHSNVFGPAEFLLDEFDDFPHGAIAA